MELDDGASSKQKQEATLQIYRKGAICEISLAYLLPRNGVHSAPLPPPSFRPSLTTKTKRERRRTLEYCAGRGYVVQEEGDPFPA